jgi:hypothetical protein
VILDGLQGGIQRAALVVAVALSKHTGGTNKHASSCVMVLDLTLNSTRIGDLSSALQAESCVVSQ